jgi:hypothetical protein
MPIDDAYGLELASAARMRCSERPTRTFQATIMLQMLYLSRFPLTDSKLQQATAEHSKASKLLSTKILDLSYYEPRHSSCQGRALERGTAE